MTEDRPLTISVREAGKRYFNLTVLTPVIEEKKRLGGRRCAHCNQPGDLVECHYGPASAWLHRECVDAWRSAYDRDAGGGREIPGFLDRRSIRA
jgi:hypothetical protein